MDERVRFPADVRGRGVATRPSRRAVAPPGDLVLPRVLRLSERADRAANRLTGGGLHFLVSSAPWTHRFWSGLFYTLVLRLALASLTFARRSPAAGARST